MLPVYSLTTIFIRPEKRRHMVTSAKWLPHLSHLHVHCTVYTLEIMWHWERQKWKIICVWEKSNVTHSHNKLLWVDCNVHKQFLVFRFGLVEFMCMFVVASRRDTIPFCQWWFYVIQLLLCASFRVCSLLLFAQCDELACAAHWALNRHREHRINCDCLYTYINNLHTDGNACLCFVFSSVPLFFVRVCALSFHSVCDSMYKMDCDVDTGNSFPCQR